MFASNPCLSQLKNHRIPSLHRKDLGFNPRLRNVALSPGPSNPVRIEGSQSSTRNFPQLVLLRAQSVLQILINLEIAAANQLQSLQVGENIYTAP